MGPILVALGVQYEDIAVIEDYGDGVFGFFVGKNKRSGCPNRHEDNIIWLVGDLVDVAVAWGFMLAMFEFIEEA